MDDPEKVARIAEARAWLDEADARAWREANDPNPELDRERRAFVPEALAEMPASEQFLTTRLAAYTDTERRSLVRGMIDLAAAEESSGRALWYRASAGLFCNIGSAMSLQDAPAAVAWFGGLPERERTEFHDAFVDQEARQILRIDPAETFTLQDEGRFQAHDAAMRDLQNGELIPPVLYDRMAQAYHDERQAEGAAVGFTVRSPHSADIVLFPQAQQEPQAMTTTPPRDDKDDLYLSDEPAALTPLEASQLRWKAAEEAEQAENKLAEVEARLEPVVDQDMPADFRSAARETTATPQNVREADVAAVIHEFEQATGGRDTPEREAYTKDWQALGDQIGNEPDLEKRAELRNFREALSHDYAALLAGKAGTFLRFSGDQEAAREMQSMAATRREIATGLRGEGPQNDPAGGLTVERTADIGTQVHETAEPSARQQFTDAALEASGLGRTARVEFVAEGPANMADMADSPGLKLAAHQAEIGAYLGYGPGGMIIYTGQSHRPVDAPETYYDTDPHRPGEAVAQRAEDYPPLSPAVFDALTQHFAETETEVVDRENAERLATYAAYAQNSKAAQAEIAAHHGSSEGAGSEMTGEMDDRRTALMAYLSEHFAESESVDGERTGGPENYAAAFRSFGGRGM
jgi:hypothetical protein